MSTDVSNFLGISVSMWVDPAASYASEPHVHASYGSRSAAYSIVSGNAIGEGISTRANGFLREWIDSNRLALIRNWERIHNNQPPNPIQPLE